MGNGKWKVNGGTLAPEYINWSEATRFDATTVIKSSVFNGSLTNSSTTKQYIGGFIGWGGLDSSHPGITTLDGCLFDGTYRNTNNFNPIGYCVDTYSGVTLKATPHNSWRTPCLHIIPSDCPKISIHTSVCTLIICTF